MPTPDAPTATRIAAALDIGSNTLKMTVARIDGGHVVELFRRSDTVRLSLGLDATGRMAEDRVEAALAALTAFVAEARAAGAETIVAVATEAIRVAENGPAVRARIERAIGVAVELISGDREAELTFRGVMASADPTGDLIIADVGGASTELIVATDGVRRFARSLPIGSGRMTDRHVRSDPPSTGELDAVHADATAVMREAGLPPTTRPRMLIVGGTGEFLFRLARDSSPKASLAELEAMVDRLTAVSALELTTLIAIPEARARVLPAGASIALAVADVVRPASIAAGPSGIRTGLLLELAGGVRT